MNLVCTNAFDFKVITKEIYLAVMALQIHPNEIRLTVRESHVRTETLFITHTSNEKEQNTCSTQRVEMVRTPTWPYSNVWRALLRPSRI